MLQVNDWESALWESLYLVLQTDHSACGKNQVFLLVLDHIVCP